MIDRTEERFGLKPERLAADTAYGSARCWPGWSRSSGIEPHIPVFDKSRRKDGTFSREDFTYDDQADSYICPAGKPLRPRRKVYKVPPPLIDANGMIRYRASKADCDACPLKPHCCPNMPARKILRHRPRRRPRHGPRRSTTRRPIDQSRRERKKVEMLFAHLKRILRLDRLRLRGPNGAHDEFLLAATAQNLRKLAKLRPKLPPTVQPA